MRATVMGIWPFGRDPANIEIVSRVITGATQNGYRLRGKLTIHFMQPQRQADADEAGDRCAALAAQLLREAPDHGSVVGAEAHLSAELLARYPSDVARARAIDLAALHVVGDPALSDELRRASGTSASGSMPAVSLSSQAQAPPSSGRAPSSPPVRPPSVPPPTAGAGPRSRGPEPSSAPGARPRTAEPSSAPGPASVNPGAPPRRRGTSQIRSIQSLLMPPGTSPAAMGQFVAPLVRDSAARLLIGFLRAHDLIAVRGVSIDEGSAEVLANLVPASDAPPGGYEASRAGEIARWQTTLGQGVMFALQHEVRVTGAYLAKDALARAEVMPALADAVIEAVCAAAFPEEAGLLNELARFPSDMAPGFVAVMAATLTRLAGTSEDPAALASALAPLFAMVQEDLSTTALIIKQSSGG
jgi:hypothetical protein